MSFSSLILFCFWSVPGMEFRNKGISCAEYLLRMAAKNKNGNEKHATYVTERSCIHGVHVNQVCYKAFFMRGYTKQFTAIPPITFTCLDGSWFLDCFYNILVQVLGHQNNPIPYSCSRTLARCNVSYCYRQQKTPSRIAELFFFPLAPRDRRSANY